MFLFKRLPCALLALWIVPLAGVLMAHSLRAQVVPSAEGPPHALWVGTEFSMIHAGFPYQSNQSLAGVGIFADYHFKPHVGLEAAARFLNFNSFYGETESNYLAGPRYMIHDYGRLQPYAQCLVGMGAIQYPFNIGSGRYLALAPGAGVNYHLARRWTVNGEYEYQFWPGSPGLANEPEHPIAPNGFHVGLSYRVFR